MFLFCFQDVLDFLENIIEQYKNKSVHEVQMNTTTREELKTFVFETVVAFEKFALEYGKYHLNDSVSQIGYVNRKLGEFKWNFPWCK